MIDIKRLRSNTEEIKQSLFNRQADVDIDQILEMDHQRRDLLFELDQVKQQRNENSSKIAKIKLEPEEKQLLINETRHLGDQIKKGDQQLREIEEKLNAVMLTIPNTLDSDTPTGKSEDDNIVVRNWGEIPKFDFKPKHHADLAVELDILDFVRGVKLAHSRFTLVKKAGALLERALINFMLDIHVNEHGFQEILPPLLVNTKSMTGAGQLPKFEEDLFKTTEGLYLIPTSEVPLTNIHQDEILKEEDLPLHYTAYTPNFRSEAGSYGKDTKGYIRQHQFNKVEMVMLTHPSESYDELEKMVGNAEVVLQRLELPYRVITLCSADIGFSAAKCYDLEVWIPSEDKYREISSCSNCTDFQARRANIRYKPSDGSKTQFVHTLNGSGVAVGRTVVAIIENYQQENNTITVPKALVPYMNGLTKIEA